MSARFPLGLLAFVTTFAQSDLLPLRVGPFRNLNDRGTIQALVEVPDERPLRPQDFQFFEDGALTSHGKEVQAFRKSGWRVAYVLAIDVSRSLAVPKVEQVKTASTEFVTQVRDPVALITFAGTAAAIGSFDSPREEMASAIARLHPVGNKTLLYDAVDKSLDLMEKRGEPERQRIVVISDGADDSRERPDYIDGVISRAEKRRVAIDTIWIPTSTAGARNTLVRLSERTGGFHADASESADIQTAMNRVLDRVNNAFVVSFERKVDTSGPMTREIGIGLSLAGVGVATVPAQIPRSSLVPVRRSWLETFRTMFGFLVDLKSLLAVLGAFVAYTFIFLAVKKYRPDQVGKFPFDPTLIFMRRSDIKRRRPIPVAVSPTPNPRNERGESRNERGERKTIVERSPGTEQQGDPGSLTLRAVKGPLSGQSISIVKQNFQIGAEPDNDLCIPSDEYVSGHHASFQASKNGWLLADNGSRNGTYLDGDKLMQGPGESLRTGQMIRIGSSEFRVTVEGHRVSAAVPAGTTVR